MNDTDNRPSIDDPARIYTPTDQSWSAKILCKIFDHAWNPHPFKEGPDTRPAASCRVCSELRIFDRRITDDTEVEIRNDE